MFRKRTKLISAKARELLFADGNYITVIFALIILALAMILPFSAYCIMYGLVDMNLLTWAFWLAELFVAFPIWWGIVRVIGLASKNADRKITDVFYAFGSLKSYIKSFLLSLTTPTTIGFVVACVVVYSIEIQPELTTWIYVACILASCVLLSPLSLRLFAVAFLVVSEDEGIVNAVKLSWRYTRKNMTFLIVFILKTLPLLLISVAAICVPLFIYTLPFLFCAYSVLCRKLIILENMKDICPTELSAGVEEINEQD